MGNQPTISHQPQYGKPLKCEIGHLMDRSARTKPEEADEWFHVPTEWFRNVQRKLSKRRKKKPGPVPLSKLFDSSGRPKAGLKKTKVWYDQDKLAREQVSRGRVGWRRMSDEQKIRMIQTRQIYRLYAYATVWIGPDGDYVSVTRELWHRLVEKYGTDMDVDNSTSTPDIYLD